jgi:hypothetical protein
LGDEDGHGRIIAYTCRYTYIEAVEAREAPCNAKKGRVPQPFFFAGQASGKWQMSDPDGNWIDITDE